jgi:hypothetical protein
LWYLNEIGLMMFPLDLRSHNDQPELPRAKSQVMQSTIKKAGADETFNADCNLARSIQLRGGVT